MSAGDPSGHLHRDNEPDCAIRKAKDLAAEHNVERDAQSSHIEEHEHTHGEREGPIRAQIARKPTKQRPERKPLGGRAGALDQPREGPHVRQVDRRTNQHDNAVVDRKRQRFEPEHRGHDDTGDNRKQSTDHLPGREEPPPAIVPHRLPDHVHPRRVA